MGLFGGSVNDQILEQRVVQLEREVASLREAVAQLTRAQTTSAYGTPPAATSQHNPVSDAGMSIQGLPLSGEYVPSPTVSALIRSGRKIEAIKAIREETGLGLKDAKDLQERIEASGRY